MRPLERADAFCARYGFTMPIVLAPMAVAPPPAPYPVQRGLTAMMKGAGALAGDHHRMQVWAGQSSAMAKPIPAGDLATGIWKSARALLM